MKKLFLLVCLLGIQILVIAQEKSGYQTPPKEIMDLVMARPTPMVSFNAKADHMVLMQRASLPPVEELAQPEYRIAGLRMNPSNFGGSRQTYFNSLQIKETKSGKTVVVSGLPADLRGSSLQWNPSQQGFALLHYGSTAIDLYTVDLVTAVAKKVNQHPLNDVVGTSFIWQNDSTIIYKAAVNAGKKEPVSPVAPTGPVIQESMGTAAASRTYQDLIKSPYDETLFEHYAKGQLYRLQIKSGKEEKLGEAAIYRSFFISPNQQFLLTATLEKPFSYLVPWSGFPTTFSVSNLNGEQVLTIAKNPSSEGAPIGFDDVVTYPRFINWRDDRPATIYFVMALDNGKGRAKSEYRDGVYCIDLTKEKEPKLFTKTIKRYRGIEWGNDQVALLYEGMNADRSYRINLLNPVSGKLDSLQQRSSNDQYNDLGQPITTRNQYGRNVIQVLKNGSILLTSNGASEKGDLPCCDP